MHPVVRTCTEESHGFSDGLSLQRVLVATFWRAFLPGEVIAQTYE